MPNSLTIAIIDNPLPYETDLKYINEQINKIMNKNRVKREPFDKKVLVGKGKTLFNEQITFCLLSEKSFLDLEKMDVIYTPKT